MSERWTFLRQKPDISDINYLLVRLIGEVPQTPTRFISRALNYDYFSFHIVLQSIAEVKKEISELRLETQEAGFDIGAVSKMLDRLPYSSEEDVLDGEGLQLLGRVLKEKSELIYKHMERLYELEYKIAKDN